MWVHTCNMNAVSCHGSETGRDRSGTITIGREEITSLMAQKSTTNKKCSLHTFPTCKPFLLLWTFSTYSSLSVILQIFFQDLPHSVVRIYLAEQTVFYLSDLSPGCILESSLTELLEREAPQEPSGSQQTCPSG